MRQLPYQISDQWRFWSLAVKSHLHVLQKGLRSIQRVSIPKVLHQKSYRKGTVIFLWLRLDFFRMSLPHCLCAACSGAPGLGCLPILWGVRQQFLKSSFFTIEKLGKLIVKDQNSCLSAGVFLRITGHLVITESSSNKSKWKRNF